KTWFRFPKATPGKPNASEEASPPLKINEIHFASGQPDWVELFNPLFTEASVTGLFLSTHRDLKHRIPLTGKIPARGFLSFPVSVGPTKEELNVYLIDTAQTVLDCHTVALPSKVESWQVWPDGSDEWFASRSSSRNEPNQPKHNTDV